MEFYYCKQQQLHILNLGQHIFVQILNHYRNAILKQLILSYPLLQYFSTGVVTGDFELDFVLRGFFLFL